MSSITGYNPATIPTLSSGTYHHIALTISGSIHTLYLDGSAVAQNLSGGNIFAAYSALSNMYVGCAGDLSYGYTGSIDDLKIWNRALPAADVSTVYWINASSLPTPIVKIPFTTSGTIVNTGTLNTATVTITNTGTTTTGPNGTTTVYQIAGTGYNGSSGSNRIYNFGNLYNFTVTWWEKNAGYMNRTLIYLATNVGNTKRLLGTNDVNTTINFFIDGDRTNTGDIVETIYRPIGSYTNTSNVWTHYALAVSNSNNVSTVSVYANGNYISSATFINYINPFTEFYYLPDFLNYFWIYNLCVYDSTLSAAHINTIYTQK